VNPASFEKGGRGMNNFRFSNYKGSISAEYITEGEREILENASPLVERL